MKLDNIINNNNTINEEKTLHRQLNFAALEAYKQIRANLSFMVPSDENRKCKVIGITSSIRGEGKSTTAINLSYVLAEAGERVMLIDGDLRLGSLAKKLNLKSTTGLSDLFLDKGQTVIRPAKSNVSEKWSVITSGPYPPNPSELLGSNRFKKIIMSLDENFDYCIIDLPPVNEVSDAITVSPVLDGLIVVVREHHTTEKELAECIRKLQIVDAKIFGFIATGNTSNIKRYGKKYGKYGKQYGYGYYKK